MLVKHKNSIVYSLSAFAMMALAGFNLFLIEKFDFFSLPPMFALGILLELLLIISAGYFLTLALKRPLLVVASIIQSAWKGVKSNPHFQAGRQSRLGLWASRRLNPGASAGLVLTIGAVIAAIFLTNFLSVLLQVMMNGSLTQIDHRVANLMPSIRTSDQTHFFTFITFLANWESALLLTLLVAVWLWFNQQKLPAILFGVALVAEEGSAYVIKHIVGRARPNQMLWLIREDPLSFPSGHTLRATVLFGLVAYFLVRSFRSHIAKLLTVLSCIIAVALVAISRLYLDVHFLSDVLGSILFGGFLLSLLITACELWLRFYSTKAPTIRKDRILIALPLVLVIWSLIASPIFIKVQPVVSTAAKQSLPVIDMTSVKSLPLYSETLTGARMEPISFIYVGSQTQIEQLFLSHGWYKADPSTLANTLQAVSVAFQNRQYLNAPVTPSYLNSQPENMAFEKPTEGKTLRQRHHTRLWQTNFDLPDGRAIWVATASLDEGVELASRGYLPTHHINPDIDAERGYIVQSLGINNQIYIQAVGAQLGKNASGDQFFTDGKAALINL